MKKIDYDMNFNEFSYLKYFFSIYYKNGNSDFYFSEGISDNLKKNNVKKKSNKINKEDFEVLEELGKKYLLLDKKGSGFNNYFRDKIKLNNSKKIYRLDLTNSNLDYFPGCLKYLKDLEVLWISNNSLRFIPSEITSLLKLENFYCRNNFVTNIHPSICEMKNLVEADFTGNKLNPDSKKILNDLSQKVIVNY